MKQSVTGAGGGGGVGHYDVTNKVCTVIAKIHRCASLFVTNFIYCYYRLLSMLIYMYHQSF